MSKGSGIFSVGKMVQIDVVHYWVKLNKNDAEVEGHTASFAEERPINRYDCGEKILFVYPVHKGNNDYNVGWQYIRFFLFYSHCLSGNITEPSRENF